MNTKPDFTMGQKVYHRCTPEESGIITGIIHRPNGFSYFVTWTDRCETLHYAIELTTEKSFET